MMEYADIDKVRMMSDGCGGLQKNAIFTTLCVEVVIKHLSIQQIDHKFFETGHSQMECDSMHSVIEKATKKLQFTCHQNGLQQQSWRRNTLSLIMSKDSHFRIFLTSKNEGNKDFHLI